MKGNGLLAVGIVGTVIAAVCCFTPVLVVGLAAVGLAGWASSASLDVVLLGLLGVFLAITAYALVRRLRATGKRAAHEAGHE